LSEPVIATWSLSLYAKCPYCREVSDILDDGDFWIDAGIDAMEVETKRSNNLEVVCPECDHEFMACCEQ
tara:strand:- start:227 stop:433 length:207 start_codon:yes stop_codon:yes gene_type:complete